MVLERYSILERYIRVEENQEEKIEHVLPVILEDDTKLITLSNLSPISKDFVTAHNLADYRRKGSSMLLIPNVDCSLDILRFNVVEEVNKCTPTL